MPTRSTPLRLLRLVAALLSGLLLALCFPPWSLGELVWIWCMPLLIALWSQSDLPPKPPAAEGESRWARIRRRAVIHTRVWRGARLGFATGLTFFTINLHWIFELRHIIDSAPFALLGLVALAAYLALFPAAWGAFAATVGRPSSDRLSSPLPDSTAPESEEKPPSGRARLAAIASGIQSSRTSLFATSLASLQFALLNAAAWAGLEWVRGWLLTGFSWNGLGVALHSNPTLIQAADLVGVTGLSFLPIFVACVLLQTAWRIHLEAGSRRLRPHLDFMLAVVLVILTFFYGVRKASQLAPENAINLRAVLVQPNIAQSLKWDPDSASDHYKTINDLTRINLETQSFDLVVWPEAALPLYFDHPANTPFLEGLLELGDHGILLGTTLFDPRGELTGETEIEGMYNSAALVQGDLASTQVHHKSHLVPFGEFLPLRRVFPPFDWLFGDLLSQDFNRGSSTEPLRLKVPSSPGDEILLSPLICFEDTVGRVVRRLVRPGPQVLVNVTNDGWFGESVASEQHLINASFRCIELRRPMIRCANTGVSGYIDPTGSLYEREVGDGFHRRIEDPETGNTFIRGTLPGTLRVDPDPPMTLYARVGDAFSALCLLGAAIGSLLWKKRQRT